MSYKFSENLRLENSTIQTQTKPNEVIAKKEVTTEMPRVSMESTLSRYYQQILKRVGWPTSGP